MLLFDSLNTDTSAREPLLTVELCRTGLPATNELKKQTYDRHIQTSEKYLFISDMMKAAAS
jgi:hypothetical protein